MMNNFPLPHASEHALRYAKQSGCKSELLSILRDDGRSAPKAGLGPAEHHAETTGSKPDCLGLNPSSAGHLLFNPRQVP